MPKNEVTIEAVKTTEGCKDCYRKKLPGIGCVNFRDYIATMGLPECCNQNRDKLLTTYIYKLKE